jgi:hypothetical protein
MKIMLLLLSAAYSNSNTYIDAGATVEVGPEKHQITEERARDLVKSKLAEASEVDEDGDENDDVSDDLTGKTVPQLKKTATDEGVDLSAARDKKDILAAIRKHRG